MPETFDIRTLADHLEGRRSALAIAAAVMVAALVGLAWWLSAPPQPRPLVAGAGTTVLAPNTSVAGISPVGPPVDIGSQPPTDLEDSAPPSTIVVHVVGAVQTPGVVTLDDGARVVDAVEAAGGVGENADLASVNLALPLPDGAQVRVPQVGDDAGPTVVMPATGANGDDGIQAGVASGATAMVDVNKATVGELEALPGIGPSLARAIVEYRTQNGPFVSVDQLLSVPGIGPAKLDRLADAVEF